MILPNLLIGLLNYLSHKNVFKSNPLFNDFSDNYIRQKQSLMHCHNNCLVMVYVNLMNAILIVIESEYMYMESLFKLSMLRDNTISYSGFVLLESA